MAYQVTIYDVLADSSWESARRHRLAELDRREEEIYRSVTYPGQSVDSVVSSLRALPWMREHVKDPGWLPERPGRRMPSVWALVQYWAPRGVFVVCVPVPHCFGCQRMILPDEDEAPLPPDDPRPAQDRWNNALGRLERAHLVDRAAGGLDGCQNIVPLCRPCHRRMPSFDIGEGPQAVAWVRARFARRMQARRDDAVRRCHRREPDRPYASLAALAECSVQHVAKIIRTTPADWQDPILARLDEAAAAC